MGNIFGYIRVSSRDQKEDRQLIALKELAIPEKNIFIDKQSGKDFKRPQYRKMIRRVRKDDLLYIKSIDRLGRNYAEILEQWRILTKDKGIDIRLYDIIYKVVEEMEAALKGKLEPEYEEKVLGEAEVRKLFKFSKVGTIAGSYVTSGVIKRGAKARVIRDGVVVIDSTIGSLAREKDQAKEVKQGLECGITIENFNDIKEKDIIEAYELVEIKR